MMTMPRRRWLPLLAVTAMTSVGLTGLGCTTDFGYQFGETYSGEVRTIAVPLFENRTYTPGLDRRLTEALIKQIHSTTPWRVVASDAADTELTGVITDAELRKLSTDQDSGLGREFAYILTVSFEWKELSTGRVLAARRNFRAAEPFAPGAGASERIGVGERAALDEMARELVASLRSEW